MTDLNYISRRVFRDNPETESQHIDTSFPVSAPRLFAALTQPDQLSTWFRKVETDEFTFNFEYGARGRIESCEKLLFFISWEIDEVESFINVDVEPTGENSAALYLGFSTVRLSRKTKFVEEYGAGATRVGGDISLVKLDRYLTGKPIEIDSEEYQELVNDSSRLWQKADVESGLGEREAAELAAQTREFYSDFRW